MNLGNQDERVYFYAGLAMQALAQRADFRPDLDVDRAQYAQRAVAIAKALERALEEARRAGQAARRGP